MHFRPDFRKPVPQRQAQPGHSDEVAQGFSPAPRRYNPGDDETASCEKSLAAATTPSLGAPPLLNQEGSWYGGSPPQMRRGGAPSDGVVAAVDSSPWS